MDASVFDFHPCSPSVGLFLPSSECFTHVLPKWRVQSAGCFSRATLRPPSTPLSPRHVWGWRAACRTNSWSIKPQAASWTGGDWWLMRGQQRQKTNEACSSHKQLWGINREWERERERVTHAIDTLLWKDPLIYKAKTVTCAHVWIRSELSGSAVCEQGGTILDRFSDL